MITSRINSHIVRVGHKAHVAEHGGFVAVAFADVIHIEHALWYIAVWLLVSGGIALWAEFIPPSSN